jgi:hypothetical protein
MAAAARLLDNAPRQVVCESVWEQLFQSYRALDAGYGALLETPGAADADSAEHAQTTLAACRAMHAMGKCSMLLQMRYREPAAALWPRIERLMSAAQARAQPSATLTLYPDCPAETTLAREYLTALLLHMAPLSNLLPAQIHGVDLLLRSQSATFCMGSAFDPVRMPFALDPAGDAKPLRWVDGCEPRPGMRFFGPGEAYAGIVAERARAEHGRSVPQWLAPSQLSPERAREMLDRLIAQWSPAPPARRQRREAASGEILVAHDFALIRRLIGFSELACTGRSLEYDRFSAYAINGMVRGSNEAQLRGPNEQPVSAEEAVRNLETFERALEAGSTEIWRVVDASADGLGVEVTGKGAWAKAGMLVACRCPESPRWNMAVVRRLNRQPNDILRVGLRKLPGASYCARVNVNDPRQPGAAKAGPALHYDAIKLAGDPPSLLLPPGVFDPSWRYTLTVGHRWDFVRMQGCTECGLDFEQIAFEVVKSQQAA